MTTDPGNIRISDYNYFLPEEKIAFQPLSERDASRLLIYRAGQCREDIYRNLATHIPADSLMIFNDTRVVEARLLFQKPTGGLIEIFCLEPHEQYAGPESGLQQKGSVLWKCLVGGASKWKTGQVLEKILTTGSRTVHLTARYIDKRSDAFIIQLNWDPNDMSFADLLHQAGAIPLPPYIKRNPELSDSERYQTVYAKSEGSVAAPTAGLHFSPEVLELLDQKAIRRTQVTLHVGAATFKPVKSETMAGHTMHSEWMEVPVNTIEQILQYDQKDRIAVGTTSLRTVETLYWLGVKCLLGGMNTKMFFQDEWATQATALDQWEAYDPRLPDFPAEEALKALLGQLEKNNQKKLVARTRLLIVPGYRFRIINGLITNFHQPRSTLLLLVAAFVGDDWRKIYQYALDHQFRFLSYGDGNLLWREVEGKV